MVCIFSALLHNVSNCTNLHFYQQWVYGSYSCSKCHQHLVPKHFLVFANVVPEYCLVLQTKKIPTPVLYLLKSSLPCWWHWKCHKLYHNYFHLNSGKNSDDNFTWMPSVTVFIQSLSLSLSHLHPFPSTFIISKLFLNYLCWLFSLPPDTSFRKWLSIHPEESCFMSLHPFWVHRTGWGSCNPQTSTC